MGKRPGWACPYLGFSLRLPSTLFVSSEDLSARRRQVTERSERTVEEAENHRISLGALTL